MHTTPERDFDEIASLAAQICNTSMALIGFIDSSQEWLKAGIGFACSATPREESFCQYVVAHDQAIFEIADARVDERFKAHPSVLGGPNISFYAGVQVLSPEGKAVGTLCVVDSKPGALTESQRSSLLTLSRQVTTLLELRKSVAGLQKAMDEQKWYLEQLETYQKKLEEANLDLVRESTQDGLTKLSNRRAFERRLEEEAGRARRHGHPLSLLMLDADQFKSYNDTFGHPAGDEVIKTIAQNLSLACRGSDQAARYGGEEFVIILPQTGPEGANIIAERIRRAVENAPWPHRKVTVSLGAATSQGDQWHERELLAAADAALYQAKKNGRNRVWMAGKSSPA
jgi:diguanylate cyclase (GGDEF)-like protein